MLERDIEAYLVKRVEALGGEIRKVQWVGRKGAPDRVVMIAPGIVVHPGPDFGWTVWVELKAPGGLAKFPSDARERAQFREHERMRRCGQHVVVIDSYAGVDALLGK